MTGPVVLKLGGELLEQPQDVERIAAGIAALASVTRLVVVHGGGKEIDRALNAAGIEKIQVDGVRVTDAPTLDVVIAVVAGAINTRLVAAVRGAGGRPVGLTGADTGVLSVRRAAPLDTASGKKVNLGLVGAPINNGAPRLLTDLLAKRYVPIVACVGAAKDGQLLNVNADTLAAHVAVQLDARRLIIAGGTSGVLDESGRTIDRLSVRQAARLIKKGTVNAGMVAKLQACRAALRGGVGDVLIVNGRDVNLASLGEVKASRAVAASGTQVVA
jgi:acetylglutamate kinase